MILHTDDVHCGVTDGLGYAGVAAYKAEMEQTHSYVALVDCGDAVQGDARRHRCLPAPTWSTS